MAGAWSINAVTTAMILPIEMIRAGLPAVTKTLTHESRDARAIRIVVVRSRHRASDLASVDLGLSVRKILFACTSDVSTAAETFACAIFAPPDRVSGQNLFPALALLGSSMAGRDR